MVPSPIPTALFLDWRFTFFATLTQIFSRYLRMG